jgi:hypothetical protein
VEQGEDGQAEDAQAEAGEVRVIIPSDAKTMEGLEKKLQPLKPSITKSELRVNASDFSGSLMDHGSKWRALRDLLNLA